MKEKFKKDDKIFDEIQKHTIKCKCGHSNVLMKRDRMICKWCGNYVYKDKKTEFEYKLKKELKNEKI